MLLLQWIGKGNANQWGYQLKKNTYVYSLSFADDQVVLVQEHDAMECMARKLKEQYEEWGLTINLEKTKYICIGEGKEILKLEKK